MSVWRDFPCQHVGLGGIGRRWNVLYHAGFVALHKDDEYFALLHKSS